MAGGGAAGEVPISAGEVNISAREMNSISAGEEELHCCGERQQRRLVTVRGWSQGQVGIGMRVGLEIRLGLGVGLERQRRRRE